MEAQSYTAEERRAANQVWAAAGAYGFEPLFLARNTDGTIDFYMNCIVGLVHKYYGDALVRSLFDTWEGDLRQTMLDDLSWLYLESAAYALELPGRPVLSALRRAHADYFFGIQYKLSRQEWMAKNQLVYSMQAARWRAVQGRTPPVMTPYEKSLSAALSPETPPRPEELKAALLAVYAKFELFDGTVHQKAGLHLHLDGLLASLMTRTMPTQMIKTDRVTVEHSGAVDASGGGVHHLKAVFFRKALVGEPGLLLLGAQHADARLPLRSGVRQAVLHQRPPAALSLVRPRCPQAVQVQVVVPRHGDPGGLQRGILHKYRPLLVQLSEDMPLLQPPGKPAALGLHPRMGLPAADDAAQVLPVQVFRRQIDKLFFHSPPPV